MPIVKFKPNRVRRNYLGGKGIDVLQNRLPAKDTDQPEEWIASTIEASNKGLHPVENEGLSVLDDQQLFIERIQANPAHYLGNKHIEKYGLSLGFLMKLLDSSMRLHTQAHPTREFAQKYLKSEWGKFEAYYILKIRDAEEGYIRLGFQHAPTKEQWQKMLLEQDLERMDACFEKIPIREGDVVYIPGGVPHAIGENVLMVEIMEPSDLVIRCEFEREGIVVPEEARFMGKGMDFCLDVFDYTAYSVVDIQEKFFLEKQLVAETSVAQINRLVPASIAHSFEVFSLALQGTYHFEKDERFWTGVCTKGSVKITADNKEVVIERGESFFLASTAKKVVFEVSEATEICLVSNVLD